jgi:putative hydrolase of the HAD superfamily
MPATRTPILVYRPAATAVGSGRDERMATIRAVLFDVGGPLDTEVTRERLIDRHIREILGDEGVVTTDAGYAEAEQEAIRSFASNAYQAIIWRLCGGDAELARRVYRGWRARAAERDLFEPREGMASLLERLIGRGLLLGLAANQPLAAIDRLDRAGIGRLFRHREVSATHGFHKPDPRLFLRACEDLGIEPAECIMVGDRIDNDVAPAKLLGMRAILFRTGRHIEQQPRTWLEIPDAEVRDVPGLEAAILELLVRG